MKFELRRNKLYGHASDRRKSRAQHFMTANNFLETAFERRSIEVAEQTHARRDVVSNSAGFQFVDEPQPLLSKRKGRSLRLAGFFLQQPGQQRPLIFRRQSRSLVWDIF